MPVRVPVSVTAGAVTVGLSLRTAAAGWFVCVAVDIVTSTYDEDIVQQHQAVAAQLTTQLLPAAATQNAVHLSGAL
jgi:hypothetical protein